MSKVVIRRAFLLAAGTLIAAAGAVQPAAAKPWTERGGYVFTKPSTPVSTPLVLRESSKASLTKAKLTVTPRSGATTPSTDRFEFPVSKLEWFTNERDFWVSGALHRGALEFKGKNGVRVGLGNIRLNNGVSRADLLVNGSRIVTQLPVLNCGTVETAEDVAAFEVLFGAQGNYANSCALRFEALGISLLNGLTGTSAFGRGTFAYAATTSGAGQDGPVRPGSEIGTN